MKEPRSFAPAPDDDNASPRTGPGSARSVLLTLLGEFVYPSREPTWTATLLYAFQGLGIAEKAARQALARAAAAGWIESDRAGRRASWRLTERGAAVIGEGSQRVRAVSHAAAAWKGDWIALHISLPEARRADRLRLYRALSWLGFGCPTPGLWICPHEERADAARAKVEELGLTGNTIALSARALQFGVPERALVAQAWDLDLISAHYDELLARFNSLRPRGDAAVFLAHVELVNTLQRLPAIDPGLPAPLLPANWQGGRAAARLDELRARWRSTAHAHWQQVAQHEG